MCHRGSQGVALVLGPEAKRAWEASGCVVEYFGTRVIAARLAIKDERGQPLEIYLASGYAPVGNAPANERAEFLCHLQQCYDKCGSRSTFLLGLDGNASIGVRSPHDDPETRDRVRGPYGVSHENQAGQELYAWLATNELCSTATYFQKRGHATWRHPCSGKEHHLDHLIMRQRDLKRVRDSGRVLQNGLDSDHHAVRLRMVVARHLKPLVERNDGKPRERMDRDLLQKRSEDGKTNPFKEQFVSAVKEEMARAADGDGSKAPYQQLAGGMKAAGKKTLMVEGRRQPGWFVAAEAKLEPAIDARNRAQAMFSRAQTLDERETCRVDLKAARKRVQKEETRARREWLKERMDRLNTKGAFNDAVHGPGGVPMDPAKAWKAVREVQMGMGQTRPTAVMSLAKADGTKCKNTEENAKRMAEYLRDVFSKSGSWDTAAVDKVRQRKYRPELGNVPTMEETVAAGMKLANGKAAGKMGLPAELYKAIMEDSETAPFVWKMVAHWWETGDYPGEFEVEKDADGKPIDPMSIEAERKRLLQMAKADNWRLRFEQANPKTRGKTFERYERYKAATTFNGAVELGATWADLVWALDSRRTASLTLLGPAEADVDAATYVEWLVARVKILPKKGDLSQCKNWRAICLLDVASKIVSTVMVGRFQTVLKEEGLEEQCGFMGGRGTADGFFAVYMALHKRKEHNLETWALFIDLVKAFDSVPRGALWAILSKFGFPHHFINLVVRLHTNAKVEFTIGDTESEVESLIGVRQGSCEGPALFLFIIQAALETMDWPVEKPEFCTREEGTTMGERSGRVRGVTLFNLWASLYADDCAIFFKTRQDLITGSTYLFSHLARFGLHMHVGRGSTKSKTEAMFFPKPRTPYEDADTSSFFIDNDGGFVHFCTEFKYLGSIITPCLTSDADVDKRIKSASAAFGALRDCVFANRDLGLQVKGRVYVALVLTILLYNSEIWCLREDLLRRLKTFHHTCVRTMCRVTLAHTHRHRIRTTTLLDRVRIKPLTYYYRNRILRWAGHVARMPMTRIPRKFLTGWVANPRPLGRPYMTWGHTLKKALKAFDIPTDFEEWTALAKNRNEWKHRTRPQENDPHTT